MLKILLTLIRMLLEKAKSVFCYFVCVFDYFILLFSLFLLLFIVFTVLFYTFYTSHCTISVNFYIYLWYF